MATGEGEAQFRGTMTMRWRLRELEPDRCEVSIEACGVPAGIDRAVHEAAFASTLENLARHLGRRLGARALRSYDWTRGADALDQEVTTTS